MNSASTIRGLAWLAALGLSAPLLGLGCGSSDVGSEELDATAQQCAGARIDAGGRCRLPNGRFAKAACCAPAPGCDAKFLEAIDACVDDWKNDGDFDPYGEMEWELYAQCADVEPMSPVRDELCATSSQPYCALSVEAFASDYLPTCQKQSTSAWLDRTCVFGEYYRDLFGRSEAIVVIGQRRLTAASAITSLQEAQILSAVGATAHEPATIGEAFEVVDQGEVHYTEIWDASARRAFTVYEVGAGDNSFGRIFAHGTTDVVATINDGDIYDCNTFWGQERRRCTADADCAGGSRCIGQSEASPLGRCIDPRLDDHPAHSTFCDLADADFGCPGGSGLLCAGAAISGSGLCLPAWQRGRFSSSPDLAIPDNSSAGAEAQVLVYGLSTVDMDVRIDLWISHPRPSDLVVTLENAGGTEAVVFDGATESAGEIYLRGRAIMGFSGDEYVNGVWRLRAVDRVTGQAGSIRELSLDVTSRWD